MYSFSDSLTLASTSLQTLLFKSSDTRTLSPSLGWFFSSSRCPVKSSYFFLMRLGLENLFSLTYEFYLTTMLWLTMLCFLLLFSFPFSFEVAIFSKLASRGVCRSAMKLLWASTLLFRSTDFSLLIYSSSFSMFFCPARTSRIICLSQYVLHRVL